MYDNVLKEEERISLELRSLYDQYGYLPYKMSKFEEYDLYVQNKEFLLSDEVITFRDTDGRLMALKPDVTLSILKNSGNGEKRKVYYDEKVYRVSAKTKQFKEIRQVGLECLGDIDVYDAYETIRLAIESLEKISQDCVLDISHLGVLSAILEEIGGGEAFEEEVVRALDEKSPHGTVAACQKYAVSKENTEKLLVLVGAYGDMDSALEKIEQICEGKDARTAYGRLSALCTLLKGSGYAEKIRLDFSVVNDRNYYDDVVFKGFINGVSEGVLSGGRYDKLLARMGKNFGGIGFAVYLDSLDGFNVDKPAYDVDVLVVYGEETPTKELIATVEVLRREGNRVRVQKSAEGARYRRLIDLRGGKV